MKLYIILLPIIVLFPGCGPKKDSPLASNLFHQASQEVKMTNYRKAINLLDQSIKVFPTPKALCLKATLLCQIGDYQSSVTLFNKIINDKKTPNAMRADSKNNCAQAQYNLGNKKEAIRLWSELCSDTDYFTPEVTYLNLALVEMSTISEIQKKNGPESEMLQYLNRAQAYLEQALRISTEYIDAQFYLANVYLRKNNLTSARETLTQLLINDPHHEPATRLLGIVENMIAKPRSADPA